ncbi:MAG: pyridoxal phosphate-dependent class II aminotransferase [Mangrovicoccus sp.]|nr:pyridoxal phosphate-dependent class II aminotransferase [Mangrovicoccus sp.]
MNNSARDHGGGVDGAAARWGGARSDWLDLSTGINPCPYPVPDLPAAAWHALPDRAAAQALDAAARRFWAVPEGAAVLAAPGASALIAQIPYLSPAGQVHIPSPTYNEHAGSFAEAGWQVMSEAPTPKTAPDPVSARVLVHPNNPTGQWWHEELAAPLLVLDESFADEDPNQSRIAEAVQPGRIILKSFGKFWGLAGLRLGFAIGDPALIAALAARLGPWPVSGPALHIGAAALSDPAWAEASRARLRQDAARLDELVLSAGGRLVGGTTLFRLYDVGSGGRWQTHLAEHRIWSRIFPYAPDWLRLGLPGTEADWSRLERVLEAM